METNQKSERPPISGRISVNEPVVLVDAMTVKKLGNLSDNKSVAIITCSDRGRCSTKSHCYCIRNLGKAHSSPTWLAISTTNCEEKLGKTRSSRITFATLKTRARKVRGEETLVNRLHLLLFFFLSFFLSLL